MSKENWEQILERSILVADELSEEIRLEEIKSIENLNDWYSVSFSESKKTIFLECRQGNLGRFDPTHLKEVTEIANLLNKEITRIREQKPIPGASKKCGKPL